MKRYCLIIKLKNKTLLFRSGLTFDEAMELGNEYGWSYYRPGDMGIEEEEWRID